MNLNARLQTEQSEANKLPLVLIHGLFGSLDNLGLLARELKQDRQIIQLDVRNHGLSPRAAEMDYALMAQDVLDTLDDLNIRRFSVIGHSMGGKIAMALASQAAERVVELVVIDIAPVAYTTRHHDDIFQALQAVSAAGITVRSEAAALMRHTLPDENVIQFLLKSFHQGEWRFNLPVLLACYQQIIGWQPLPAAQQPTLFIRGSNSPYLDEKYRQTLLLQFPNARAHVVTGAGHWVHAEKPEAVLHAIQRFLSC